MSAVPEGVAIRAATAADLGAMTDIYNAGIAARTATFEERLREPRELEAWLLTGLPVLVAERDGEIIGFARVKPFSTREVFAGIGDHGVYVKPGLQRQGVGRALLDGLTDAAGKQGMWKLTSRIFADNEGSIAAHQAAGFTIVGTQRRHAKLDGRWRDVVLVERLIGADDDS